MNTEEPIPPSHADDAGSQALAEALRSSFAIVKVVMGLLVLLFLGSGIVTVGSQERAIILRLGKPVGTGEEALLKPGLHWAFPPPIDEVVRVPISQIQSVTSTIGWYATTPEAELSGTEDPPGGSLNPATDGYVLTADGNIIHTRATLQYRITDPVKYVFEYVNASNLVQNALNNSLLFAATRFRVDTALGDVTAFRETVRSRVEQLINQQQLGITLEPITVAIIPPRQVKADFEAVLAAQVAWDNTNNAALGYQNQLLSRAPGEAKGILNAAEAERNRTIQTMAAEAKYFQDQLAFYQENPELFLKRLQAEAIQRVLTNSAIDKWVLHEPANGQPIDLRLLLNRAPEKPVANP
jgi:membrane protease subunit HflK